MAIKYKIMLLVFLSLFLSAGIFAEETIKKTSVDNDMVEYTLPEIKVVGNNSMHSLEMDVIKSEELKFDIFNNLNSTDDFDITCEWRAPLGTRIKQWSCDVGYMRKAREEEASNMILNGFQMRTRNQLAVQYAYKTRALNREMNALAVEHPELAIAMVNAHELQQLYKEERRKRYKDSIFAGTPPAPDLKLNKIDIWAAAFQDHSKKVISDKIWARWDSVYRKIFKLTSYQKLWASLNHDKYSNEFVAYVNKIIAGK